jgi:hypothetical protein
VTLHLEWMDKHFAEGGGPHRALSTTTRSKIPETGAPSSWSPFNNGAAIPGRTRRGPGRGRRCGRSTAGRLRLPADAFGTAARPSRTDRPLGQISAAAVCGCRPTARRPTCWTCTRRPRSLRPRYSGPVISTSPASGAIRQWIRPDRQSDLVNRFASSAAHVAGRNVVISESFTWLRNHYHTALSHIKAESDKLLLNGINCIYYHGICYAPKETVWPGWLFYASTQANARNSIFRDIPALNAYITRCQSMLQEGIAAQRRAAVLAGLRSVDGRRQSGTAILGASSRLDRRHRLRRSRPLDDRAWLHLRFRFGCAGAEHPRRRLDAANRRRPNIARCSSPRRNS